MGVLRVTDYYFIFITIDIKSCPTCYFTFFSTSMNESECDSNHLLCWSLVLWSKKRNCQLTKKGFTDVVKKTEGREVLEQSEVILKQITRQKLTDGTVYLVLPLWARTENSDPGFSTMSKTDGEGLLWVGTLDRWWNVSSGSEFPGYLHKVGSQSPYRAHWCSY